MLSAVMAEQLEYTRRSFDESLQGVYQKVTLAKAVVAVGPGYEVDG